MNLENLVSDLKNGDFEKYLPYFGYDYQVFFDFLSRKKILSNLNLNDINSDDFQNEYLLWLYENDLEKYYYWISVFLKDIVIENGKIFLLIDDKSDLSILFCDGYRNTLSIKTIETILSGDFDSYWDSDTTNNVYNDVIKELDKENLDRLKKYILKNLSEQKLEPTIVDTEEIASEQGHEDYWIIDSNNISDIIENEDIMNDLLDNELSDLKSELYSLHSSAYNSAYESDLYQSIWNKIADEYFIGDGEWIASGKKNNNITYRFKIELLNFSEKINKYLSEQSNTLEYASSYLSMINDFYDCLNVYPPDYPDYTKVDKNINEYFSDYI